MIRRSESLIRRLKAAALAALALTLPALAQPQGPSQASPTPTPASPAINVSKPAPPPGSVPPFEAETSDLDFGMHKPGGSSIGRMRLTNTGSAPIKITATSTNCDCTGSTVVKKLVQPGDFTHVNVAMDVPTGLGRVRREVRVFAEGFSAPFIFGVTAEVTYPIRINPGGFPQLLAKRGLVTLEAIDNKPFRVISVNGKPPQFPTAELAQAQPDRTTRVFYDWSELADDATPRFLVIETDNPEARLLPVRTMSPGVWSLWRPDGAWFPKDDTILLPDARAGTSAEFTTTLTVRYAAAQQFEVICADPAMTPRVVSTARDPASGQTKITVALTIPADRSGFFHTVLTFSSAGVSTRLDVHGVASPK